MQNKEEREKQQRAPTYDLKNNNKGNFFTFISTNDMKLVAMLSIYTTLKLKLKKNPNSNLRCEYIFRYFNRYWNVKRKSVKKSFAVLLIYLFLSII